VTSAEDNSKLKPYKVGFTVNNALRVRGRLKCFPFAMLAQIGAPRHRAALCPLNGKHLGL